MNYLLEWARKSVFGLNFYKLLEYIKNHNIYYKNHNICFKNLLPMTYIFKEHVKILEIYMVKFNTILHCITGKKLLQIGPHFGDYVKKTHPK